MNETHQLIPKDPIKLDQILEEKAGLKKSFDVGVRQFNILDKKVHVYYVNGLCDTSYIIEILIELTQINDHEKRRVHLGEVVKNRLVNQSVEESKEVDVLIDQVLSGLIAVVVEGEEKAFIIDVRSYPGRNPEEPDTEKVVRGSRDGYVENIIVNTALTRRRIRDGRLRFEMNKVGERSKTDVAIAYIEGLADPDLIDIVRKELQNICIDGIPMGDKTIEEFLVKQGYNPFPVVRYTERADIGSVHLLEGHVLLFVDTSPSVIILPATYFHHMQHAEEYRQSPAVGTFIRWLRFAGLIASIFLLPLWLLFALEPTMLPESLKFIGPNEKTNIPIVAQLFIADIGIEFLRIAAIHTPTPLSTAMGLIAAVLIGQIAIDVGLFVAEVILYVAIASIGTFATPSYELSIANKLSRMVLLVAVALFKVPGLVVAATVIIIYLAGMRALNTPYLWPLLPFDPKAFWQIFVRKSIPASKFRPSIVKPGDRIRQPINE
ncbi:stage V sporulation protein AF [Bacillus ectoiniformans]|uniref:spore germination protein n=1 Tax=Bacillus ectoiniformans TaxID=1494429 RepID=UPI00195B4A96|nr:spore germination protein [Bacillus ectoiniformans]MBM7648044.1 stage V sporulation protein AF [Bacillus ectoiniformans]